MEGLKERGERGRIGDIMKGREIEFEEGLELLRGDRVKIGDNRILKRVNGEL